MGKTTSGKLFLFPFVPLQSATTFLTIFFNYCNYEKFTFAGDFAKIQVAKGPLPCSKLRALFSTKRFVLSPHLRCSVMDHLRHGRKTQTSHQLGCEVKPRNCHDVNTVMERWGHTCLLFFYTSVAKQARNKQHLPREIKKKKAFAKAS